MSCLRCKTSAVALYCWSALVKCYKNRSAARTYSDKQHAFTLHCIL
jgi:hypothetical protein